MRTMTFPRSASSAAVSSTAAGVAFYCGRVSASLSANVVPELNIGREAMEATIIGSDIIFITLYGYLYNSCRPTDRAVVYTFCLYSICAHTRHTRTRPHICTYRRKGFGYREVIYSGVNTP